MTDTLLSVTNLNTVFTTYAGTVRAVDGISFDLKSGEVIAVVGESGCGKTVTALSIMRLIPEPGGIESGRIVFDSQDISAATESDMQRIRGNDIGMIFQDPMTSLNPVLTIERQMSELVEQHQGLSRREAKRRVLEMLRIVNIPNADTRMYQYPHQFSGGMRQRVMIAMALACNPKLVIADEPTTSLDVTIQAQILDLMKNLRSQFRTSIMLITHDLGIVAQLAERIIVMYAGKIIEHGLVRSIYYQPAHPYTWALLKSVPRLDADRKRRLMPIDGQPPDLIQPPAGCRFHPRCHWAMGICLREEPPAFELPGQHHVSCWLQHPLAPRVDGPGREVAL